jgi:hypothetical protein
MESRSGKVALVTGARGAGKVSGFGLADAASEMAVVMSAAVQDKKP